MNKQKLSAIALICLLLPVLVFGQAESVDDFLGLEMEILPDLKGHQKFTSEDFHKNAPGWNVKVGDVEMDKAPFKNQGHSLIPWSDLDPEGWLSIENWMKERNLKDSIPSWKMLLRDASTSELVGKILQCKGICQIYRGPKAVNVTHLSRILEGDEIRTDKDSVAWLFLMDGTTVRMSPDSSISMMEINLGDGKTFFHARLNEGHIFWNSRVKESFEFDPEAETDSYSLPLMVREANQQYYERIDYQKSTDEQRLASLLEIQDRGIQSQMTAARKIWEKNNSIDIPPSHAMVITPNGTFYTDGAKFDLFYNLGGEAHFKHRIVPTGNAAFQARGYLNTDTQILEKDKWYSVTPNGREINENATPSTELEIAELMTKRIRSIDLARELWIEKYSAPILGSRFKHDIFNSQFGYNYWSAERFNLRTKFLFEYSRRIETTHLRSIENLNERLASKGELKLKSPTSSLYQASLNHYLLGLKKRYSNKTMQVREMNNVQYYVWILKNGKL